MIPCPLAIWAFALDGDLAKTCSIFSMATHNVMLTPLFESGVCCHLCMLVHLCMRANARICITNVYTKVKIYC